jgi:hypothetical protein
MIPMSPRILIAIVVLSLTLAIAKSSHALWPGGMLHKMQIAQDDEGDEPSVAPKEIEQYIAVYKAMQRDHNLTVDQACAKQGITVAQFRDIENKVQDNPVVHEHVIESLNPATKKESEEEGE